MKTLATCHSRFESPTSGFRYRPVLFQIDGAETTFQATLAVFILLAFGCTATPQVYVGLYGDYADDEPEVIQILEPYDVDVRRLSVEPPAGVDRSVIIHGRSRRAADAASDIAYSLYAALGEWVSVRAGEITNHRYSEDYIGVYLVGDGYVSSRKDTESVSVVGTNVYEVHNCEDYMADLTLGDRGEFQLVGIRFGVNGTSTPEKVVGSYMLRDDVLTLVVGEAAYEFSSHRVQLVKQEPMMRTKFVPKEKASALSTPFECEFMQHLDVVTSG